MSLLLNKAKVRRVLLDHAKATRSHPFSRVSEDTYAKLEAVLRKAIVEHVRQMPSAGKTL